MENQKAFWDTVWKDSDFFKIENHDFKEFKVVFKRLHALLKLDHTSLAGKNVLDLGCGQGAISVYLAKKGANVVAVDNSEEAINYATKLAEFNNVKISAFAMDAFDIDRLDIKFDIIIGQYILHHIEPFEKFVLTMKSVMNVNGKAIFYENNARNKLLIFLRNNVVGKFNIPKYGDAEEFPFEPREIEMIKKQFKEVKITYPKFYFFDMLSIYLFKRNKLAHKIFSAVDNFFYRYIKVLNKYSYVQIIEFWAD